jgi:hypothetical protein
MEYGLFLRKWDLQVCLFKDARAIFQLSIILAAVTITGD